ADRLLAEAPRYDAVIVPSRYGMDAVLGNRALIDFIRDQSKTAHWMASNCSGALVLAEAGVLDGKRATTWAGGEASFQKKYPAVLVQHDINVVIDDGVLTSNGSVVSYEAATVADGALNRGPIDGPHALQERSAGGLDSDDLAPAVSGAGVAGFAGLRKM